MRLRWLALAAALAGGCETADVFGSGESDSATGLYATVVAPPWAEKAPTFRDIMNAYPTEAMSRDIEGLARLRCVVLATRKLDCEVASETPPGYGFGAAGLSVASIFVVRQDHPEARPGREVIVPVRFVVG